jgi:phage terminase large subunit-like protein
VLLAQRGPSGDGRCRECCADPFRWQRSLQMLEAQGVPVVEYPKTASRLTPATARFYEAVLGLQLTHSGDARLKRHLENAVLKVDARGQRITKETKYSSRRIDLAVAAVMSFDRAAQPDPNDYDILQSVY